MNFTIKRSFSCVEAIAHKFMNQLYLRLNAYPFIYFFQVFSSSSYYFIIMNFKNLDPVVSSFNGRYINLLKNNESLPTVIDIIVFMF